MNYAGFIFSSSIFFITDVACSKPHILEGTNVPLNRYPFVISIRDSAFELYDTVICGASLLWGENLNRTHSKYILTAAHCVCKDNGSTPRLEVPRLRVYAARYYVNNTPEEGVQDSGINKAICHQQYFGKDVVVNNRTRSVLFDNDIAIVRLETPFALHLNSAWPIDLNPNVIEPTVDQELLFRYTLAGWGMVGKEPTGGMIRWTRAQQLQEMSTYVKPQGVCNMRYVGARSRLYNHTTKFCHGAFPSTTAPGDSGSPIFGQMDGRWKQVGVHAVGSSYPGIPNTGLAMRISYYYNWIRETIDNDQP